MINYREQYKNLNDLNLATVHLENGETERDYAKKTFAIGMMGVPLLVGHFLADYGLRKFTGTSFEEQLDSLASTVMCATYIIFPWVSATVYSLTGDRAESSKKVIASKLVSNERMFWNSLGKD